MPPERAVPAGSTRGCCSAPCPFLCCQKSLALAVTKSQRAQWKGKWLRRCCSMAGRLGKSRGQARWAQDTGEAPCRRRRWPRSCWRSSVAKQQPFCGQGRAPRGPRWLLKCSFSSLGCTKASWQTGHGRRSAAGCCGVLAPCSQPCSWLGGAGSTPGCCGCSGSGRQRCRASREASGKLWPQLSQKYSSTTFTSTSARGEGAA